MKMNSKMYNEYTKMNQNSLIVSKCNFDVYGIDDVIIIDKGRRVDKDTCIKGKKFLGGKMMYEVSKNEIYLNKYILCELNVINLIKTGIAIIDCLESKIKEKYEKNICYILSIDDELNGTLTFHEIVNDELWIDKNLESYNNYVAVYTSRKIEWNKN